jgi:hypothetical protein
VIGFVVLATNATLLKKIGGLENTRYHGILMFGSLALGIFGWYVIYTNKEKYNKKHLVTNHGKLGIIVLIGYTALAIFGSVALHPDWGLFKTNKLFRAVHKWTGRVFTAAAWVCSVLGIDFFLYL